MLASRTQQLCLFIALTCIGLMLLSACGFGGTGLPRGVVPDPFLEPGNFLIYTDATPAEPEHLLGFGSFAGYPVTDVHINLVLALPGCPFGEQLALGGSIQLQPIRRLYAFSAAASLDAVPMLKPVRYGFAAPSFRGTLTLFTPCFQGPLFRVHAVQETLPFISWRGHTPGPQPLSVELYLHSHPDVDGTVLLDASVYAANPKSPCGTLARTLVRLPSPAQAPLTTLHLRDSISHFDVSLQGNIAALTAPASPLKLELSYQGGPCNGQSVPVVLKR